MTFPRAFCFSVLVAIVVPTAAASQEEDALSHVIRSAPLSCITGPERQTAACDQEPGLYQTIRFSLAVEAASLALQAANALPPGADLHMVQASIIKEVENQGGFHALVKPMLNLADYASLDAAPFGDTTPEVLSRSLAALEYLAPGTIDVLETRHPGLGDKIGFKPGKFQTFEDFVEAGGRNSPLAMDITSFASFPNVGGDPLLKPHAIQGVTGLRPQGIYSDKKVPVSLEAPANGLAMFDILTSRLVTAYFGNPLENGETNRPPDYSKSPFGGRMCVGCQREMPRVNTDSPRLPKYGSPESLMQSQGRDGSAPASERITGPKISEAARGDDYAGAAADAGVGVGCAVACEVGGVAFVAKETVSTAKELGEIAADAFGPEGNLDKAWEKAKAEVTDLGKDAVETVKRLDDCLRSCQTKVEELISPKKPPKESPPEDDPRTPENPPQTGTPETPKGTEDGLTVDPTTVPPETACAVGAANGQPYCDDAMPSHGGNQASMFLYLGSDGSAPADEAGFKEIFEEGRSREPRSPCVNAECQPEDFPEAPGLPGDCPWGDCSPDEFLPPQNPVSPPFPSFLPPG